MRVPYVRVHKNDAKEEISRLKANDELLRGFKIKREGEWVKIPVTHSETEEDFEEIRMNRMEHVGSFERVSDFFVIKERKGWEGILEEIKTKQSPRAIFLDSGVEGPFRIRKLRRVYGTGMPVGIHKENGLRYFINLEKAYFSPRLAEMRREITENCVRSSKSGLIVDMYAGVGPISIPLLKRGIRVISLDVNQSAVKMMARNMELNKVKGETVIADSNKMFECFKDAEQIIMNHPTQSIAVAKEIIGEFKPGTIFHITHISNRTEEVEFGGVKVLGKKIVHGYSPSSVLYYFQLQKK